MMRIGLAMVAVSALVGCGGETDSAVATRPGLAVEFSGPSRFAPGKTMSFRMVVRNGTASTYVLSSHASHVLVEPSKKGPRTFDDGAAGLKAESPSDWRILRPGQKLVLFKSQRVDSRAIGDMQLSATLSTPRLTECSPKTRPLVEAMLAKNRAQLPPRLVRSGNTLRVSFR